MIDLDELDRLHARMVARDPMSAMSAAAALVCAWPAISDRLRAAEVDAHNLRGTLGRALDDWRDARAEVERLRGALRAVIHEVAAEDEAWGGSLEQRHRAALGEP